MKKKLLWIMTFLICSVFVISLSRTLYRTWRSSQRIENLTNQVQSLKTQAEKLKKVLGERQSTEYIEKEARDNLHLVKPDEKMVVIPNTPQKEDELKQQIDLSTYTPLEQWKYLFFHN